MLRMRRGRPESASSRMEQLRLRISVIERHDQAVRRGAADVAIHRFPLQRDVGELSLLQLHSAYGEVVTVLRRGVALAPVETAVALGDPKLVQSVFALDQSRKWQRVEQFIAEDEVAIAPRYLGDRPYKLDLSRH